MSTSWSTSGRPRDGAHTAGAAPISISYNENLSSLTGLGALTRLGEADGSGLYVSQNSALRSLRGLDALTTVGTLYLQGIATPSLDGLAQLASVSDLFYVANNNALQSLQGLDTLTSVGDLRILQNSELRTLRGLEALTSAASVTIGGPPDFDCGSYDFRAATGTPCEVFGNPRLESLAGLEGLRDVSGALTVADNDALVSVAALHGVEHAGSLLVTENDSLGDAAGWTLAGEIDAIDGAVEVRDNE